MRHPEKVLTQSANPIPENQPFPENSGKNSGPNEIAESIGRQWLDDYGKRGINRAKMAEKRPVEF
jgi:hypothetical protein